MCTCSYIYILKTIPSNVEKLEWHKVAKTFQHWMRFLQDVFFLCSFYSKNFFLPLWTAEIRYRCSVECGIRSTYIYLMVSLFILLFYYHIFKTSEKRISEAGMVRDSLFLCAFAMEQKKRQPLHRTLNKICIYEQLSYFRSQTKSKPAEYVKTQWGLVSGFPLEHRNQSIFQESARFSHKNIHI